MKIVSSIEAARAARAALPGPLGFVPTMGFLHEGHLSLVRQARQECRSVAVSIFVNPTQFGPHEDLARYPRDLPRDQGLLAAEGVDLLWQPETDQMYPPGYQTWVTVEQVAAPLEGTMRPGHFRGVATVVAKLFNVIQPDRAYFGQKDAQQAAVIRRMVEDLNFPIEMVVCPTQREPDGLAMSSRNTYLNAEERRAAGVLFRALRAAQQAYQRGMRDASGLREEMSRVLAEEPMAEPQYIAIADPETFEELRVITNKGLALLAVYVGKTRLIDNMLLE